VRPDRSNTTSGSRTFPGVVTRSTGSTRLWTGILSSHPSELDPRGRRSLLVDDRPGIRRSSSSSGSSDDSTISRTSRRSSSYRTVRATSASPGPRSPTRCQAGTRSGASARNSADPASSTGSSRCSTRRCGAAVSCRRTGMSSRHVRRSSPAEEQPGEGWYLHGGREWHPAGCPQRGPPGQ